MSYIQTIKIALIVFPFLALLITFPYFLIQYHKIGTVNKFKLICFYLFVFYCLCIYFLVILPLPSIESVKKLTTPYTQLIPFSFIGDIIKELNFDISNTSTWLPVLKSRAVLQVVFNLIMLVPLGMFCRYLFDADKKSIIKIGIYTTLFFELTQLSGLYGIYPRPYRLFDIDDIMLNFAGCFIGYLLLPVFSFIPKISDIEYKAYKKINHVTFTRRLCALGLDMIILSIIDTILAIIFNDSVDKPLIDYNLSVIIYFGLSLWMTNGYTLGKKFVGIRLISDDKRLKIWQLVVRYFFIILFYFVIPIVIGMIVFISLILIFNFVDAASLVKNSIKILNLNISYDVLIGMILFTLSEGIYFILMIKNIIFKKSKSKRLLYEKLSKTEEINITKYKKDLTKM